jgi:hypothetical protein
METIKYKNYSIEIDQDCDPMNPRTEWDNLGTMVCFHKRYTLGDKDLPYKSSNYDSWDSLEKDIRKHEGDVIILPIYMYDHSGVTINTTGFDCNWDSGQVGFIFITKEKARMEYGWKVITERRLNTIQGYLKNEVMVYDQYLTGSVYGYQVKSPEGEDLDSCWGFFGSDHKLSGLLEYAQNVIDCHIEQNDTQLKLELV